MKHRIILGLFFHFTLIITCLQAVEKPTGLFASSGTSGDQIYEHASLKGGLIRATWESIEAEPGVFDFDLIDVQVNKAESEGKKWSLAVLGGGTGSPSWLIDDLGAAFVNYTFRGDSGYRLPLYWDTTVQERLSKLANVLADRYKGHKGLALVYVTQMTSNGIEGHLQGVSMEDFVAAGYTDEKWVNAAKAASRSYAAAFLNKPIAFEVHDVNGGSTVPLRIINELWNEPGLEQRVGAAMWWLSGRTDYQPELITGLTDFPGDIYGQVIGRSDQTYRFGEEDYATVFSQAQEIGIRYIEPWEYEFKSGTNSADGNWDEVFADFNAWSASAFPSSNGETGQLGSPRVFPDENDICLKWLAIQGVTYSVRRTKDLSIWETLETRTALESDWQDYTDAEVLVNDHSQMSFYQVLQH